MTLTNFHTHDGRHLFLLFLVSWWYLIWSERALAFYPSFCSFLLRCGLYTPVPTTHGAGLRKRVWHWRLLFCFFLIPFLSLFSLEWDSMLLMLDGTKTWRKPFFSSSMS